MSAPNNKPTLLCVANWDSNVGYAWWLMESFWVKIHSEFSSHYNVVIAYPSISTIPVPVQASNIQTILFDFRVKCLADLARHLHFIKRYNVQAIYFSDRAMVHWSYFFMRLAGVRKIIAHDHTPGVRTRPYGLRRIVKSIYARIPFTTVDAAIGATEFVKQRLIDINCLPAGKCHAAPNGLPPLAPSENPQLNLHSKIGINENDLLIVSTGRATLYKGIDFALEVITHLVHNQNLKGFHFIHCGDGPDLNYLKAMAHKLKISPYVTFMGRISNINQILQACDIAFHPSKGEVGYSLAILEYMRAGLPVLLSDNPSVCEATHHNVNGLIYQENSLHDACQKMTQLLTEPNLRSSLGQEGIRAIAEKYSLKSTHKALISILQRTLTIHLSTTDQ